MARSILIRVLAIFSAATVVLVAVAVLGVGVVGASYFGIWGDSLDEGYGTNGTFFQGAIVTALAASVHWVLGFVTIPIALIGIAALSYSFDSDAHGHRPDRLTKFGIVLVGGSISLGGILLLRLISMSAPKMVEISPWSLLGACIMGFCLGAGPAWLGTKVYLLISKNRKQSRPQ